MSLSVAMVVYILVTATAKNCYSVLMTHFLHNMEIHNLSDTDAPESKATTNDSGFLCREEVITHCSPFFVVEDFKSTLGGRHSSEKSQMEVTVVP